MTDTTALITVRCVHCGSPTGSVVTVAQHILLTAEESTCVNCTGTVPNPTLRNTEAVDTCPNCNETDNVYIRERATNWHNGIVEGGVVNVSGHDESETESVTVHCVHCDAERQYDDINW